MGGKGKGKEKMGCKDKVLEEETKEMRKGERSKDTQAGKETGNKIQKGEKQSKRQKEIDTQIERVSAQL